MARREIVDHALDGLKPAVRATLVLRHYYGYDYAEIGSMLGMSSGTVGSTLSRAHAAIRERLEAQAAAAAPAPVPSIKPSPRPIRRDSAEPPEVLP